MTDGGDSTGGGPGGPGRGPDDLPPDLRDLDRELRRVSFEPRGGLEEDVMGRIARGRREGGGASRRRTGGRWRRVGAAAAVLALVAALGVMERWAAGGGAGPEAGSGPAMASAGLAEGWGLRWSRDARVLAMGPGPAPRAGRSRHGLRCGRIGSRIACRGGELEATTRPEAETPAVLRDFCCLDYDGGGPEDDGVRVVAGRREAVVDFWIYEDRDDTRSFTDGDLLRTKVPGVASAGRPPGAPGGARRLDRCCADLDGGPRPDDGVFVLAGDGERVALAVLYEDVNGDGRLSPGDRLRAVRTDDEPGPDAQRDE